MKDKKKILIVDDEQGIRTMLRIVFENRGYEVIEAVNGLDALDKAVIEEPSVIIMDVMMPVMDGLTSCREILKKCACPIMLLTAKGEDDDQVIGLECGADDYVIKPVTPMVLVARVEALLRRTKGSKESKLFFGSLKIDIKSREVFIENKRISLSKKEFDLLYYLTSNQNIALSREQIVEAVWGYDYLGSDGTVDTHMNRLRTKMNGIKHYIKTNHGHGYTFKVSNEKE